ncbi:hypothetical protein MTO96_042317 [Rhipicephalus appendiculatus]
MSWSKSLAVIPETLTEEKVEAYSASRKLAKRNDERSHKFAAESYVQTASIETSSCTDSDSTLIRVRALCYRSQKKTAPLHTKCLLLSLMMGTSTIAHVNVLQEKMVPAITFWGCSSLLWCQKPVLPHHFTTYLSPDIQLGVTAHLNHPTPPEPDLFTSTTMFAPSSTLILSIQDARLLEKSSRQQSKSTEWKKARKYRLTASNFGTVVAREKWTPKGLQNLTSDKDLSRVRAVQYGISNERQAVRRYEAALRTALHDVQTFHCGLVVSPTSPWLGASPDRIVWDPQENSHGIIEVKCPYSMKDMDEPTTRGSCLYRDADNVFRLDRRHQYYYQLLGQMAICGLSWADFVVYSPQFLVVERIKHDDAAWQQCKVKLDKFYFSTLLPYFASRDHPLQPNNS